MLVAVYIYETSCSQIEKASKKSIEGLSDEAESLREWGERRVSDMFIPERCVAHVPRVCRVDDNVLEVMVETQVWDLEGANVGILRKLDGRIVSSYKRMKKIGFERPSSVLYHAVLKQMHSREIGCVYDGNPSLWASAFLVLQRLEGTARIAVRHEFPGRFGTRMVQQDDGVVFYYGKDAWENELVDRQLMPPRRRK
jgi:hypothetical protein